MSRRRNRSNAKQIGWHNDDDDDDAGAAQINYVRVGGGAEYNTENRTQKKKYQKEREREREKKQRKGTIDNIGNLLRVELMPQLRQTALATPTPTLPLCLLPCMCHKTTHNSLCSQLKEKLQSGDDRGRPRGIKLETTPGYTHSIIE